MRGIPKSVVAATTFLAVIWAVYLLDLMLPADLRALGIRPRSVSGLGGILFAPFLHANFGHIVANSAALFILLVLAFTVEYRSVLPALGVISVVGGGGSWLFGSPGVHIGASVLIFGLTGYLLSFGLYRRNPKAAIVSLAVLILYGGSLFSLLIPVPGISWSGHFFGFIGGIIAARLMVRSDPRVR